MDVARQDDHVPVRHQIEEQQEMPPIRRPAFQIQKIRAGCRGHGILQVFDEFEAEYGRRGHEHERQIAILPLQQGVKLPFRRRPGSRILQ